MDRHKQLYRNLDMKFKLNIILYEQARDEG